MDVRLQASIRRLAGVMMAGFLLSGLALTYWGIVRTDVAARPDNPRLVAAQRRARRGRLLDRGGQVLAHTQFEAGVGRRIYPLPAAAPVVGYSSWRYGVSGAEAAFDDYLSGRLGGQLRGLLAQLLHRPGVGSDVRLTLDAELQAAAAEALGQRAGAVVLLDPRDGAILALASAPTFDPNQIHDGFEQVSAQPGQPLFNRATLGLYTPGSIWKTVTLAAALERGIARLDDQFEDGDQSMLVEGYPIGCDNNPRGVLRFDLAHAYGWSCNLTFARLGLALGADQLAAQARRFGLEAAPAIEIEATAGRLGGTDGMTPLELASTAFGQGELQVTPLQMVMLAAAVAMRGPIMRPHLLEHIDHAPSGSVTTYYQPRLWRQAMSPAVAQQVAQAMRVAVEEGWAAPGQVAGGSGGKTGTAQLGGDQPPHAWYIGFAPFEQPRVAIALVVEHAGEGSRVAAPLAAGLLAHALRRVEN
jgi:peptidoglycan glycosyltransferase